MWGNMKSERQERHLLHIARLRGERKGLIAALRKKPELCLKLKETNYQP